MFEFEFKVSEVKVSANHYLHESLHLNTPSIYIISIYIIGSSALYAIEYEYVTIMRRYEV